MKKNLKLSLITIGLIYLIVIIFFRERLSIIHSIIFTGFTLVLYIMVCMENQSMKVSKVFFIKDFCILAICNLLFWDDDIDRLLLYPIYVVFLGIGLYCMYYLYKVDNGYKKLNVVEEAQCAEWREKIKGDNEEFFAPEEKAEGEDTFKKKGLKDFCSYMLVPCAITLLGDVLDIIIGFIK